MDEMDGMDEMDQRQMRAAVIKEALTWQRTPFDWGQCVKGAGVDCGRFLAASFNGSGAKRIDIGKLPRLSPQWFLHRREQGTGDRQSFLEIICLFAGEYELDYGRNGLNGRDGQGPGDVACNVSTPGLSPVQTFARGDTAEGGCATRAWKPKPEPADIVIARVGFDWAHSALVIRWPRVIAAACEHCVTVWENIYRSPQYMNRELKFFDPFLVGAPGDVACNVSTL